MRCQHVCCAETDQEGSEKLLQQILQEMMSGNPVGEELQIVPHGAQQCGWCKALLLCPSAIGLFGASHN